MSRYSAHLPLRAVGESGQRRIADSHVLMVGAGGIGCAAAQYLVSSGVGTLTVCDFDRVAESNLPRQILYRDADVGRPKAEAAAEALGALNPDTVVHAIRARMDENSLLEHARDCDFVIDASDNYGTRLAVNRARLAVGGPWVMASCIRMEGQIMSLRPDLPGQACYRCAYGTAPETLEDCPGAGIFAPVAGITGAAAACFTLAHLAGTPLPAGLHLFDATAWQWRSLGIPRNPDCKDCGGG